MQCIKPNPGEENYKIRKIFKILFYSRKPKTPSSNKKSKSDLIKDILPNIKTIFESQKNEDIKKKMETWLKTIINFS